ncbi:MAG: hypothetical protein ABIN00_04360 [candidate division WOR-3 bacterium]
MNNLIEIIKVSNDITKSLVLMILAIPITFLVQFLFFTIIKLWMFIFEDENSGNKN